MPPLKLLNRLCHLEQIALVQINGLPPTKGIYFPIWSVDKQERFLTLWMTKEPLSEIEEKQLSDIIAQGKIVDLREGEDYKESNWDPNEFTLVVVFHKYARYCSSLTMPCIFELLKEYRMRTLARLLEKYGWQVGQLDCTTSRPFDGWAPEDHAMMIELLDLNPPAAASP